MILDRIGLSSRSGTLLKFSLLGPRKDRHREKMEKRKRCHMVGHHLAGPVGTGGRQDHRTPREGDPPWATPESEQQSSGLEVWKRQSEAPRVGDVGAPLDPASLLLGVCPREMGACSHKNVCVGAHSSTILTATQRKHPRCLSADTWLNKLWSIHTMECYSAMERNELWRPFATQMELEDTMPSERIQTRKTTKHLTALLQCVQNRRVHGHRKQTAGLQGLGGWERGMWWGGTRLSLGHMKMSKT